MIFYNEEEGVEIGLLRCSQSEIFAYSGFSICVYFNEHTLELFNSDCQLF
ncbi:MULTISPECIES: hypothetical protein [Bacillus]|nr:MULTISPECIES: hypothetical protein [Bacillus]MCA1033441.1 hypothetical protein [Bacillus infantis]MDT0161556.1 hypothetical protein [Bacillus sp. AG4(2022)]